MKITEAQLKKLKREFFLINIKKDHASIIKAWNFLVDCYAQPHRVYHTLAHISYVVLEIERLLWDVSLDITQRDAVFFAGFYHDIVYDVKAADNEQQSAGYAYQSLTSLGWSSAFAGYVGDLICETAHKSPPESIAAKVLIDADLGILSEGWISYLQYAVDVRAEYSYLTDEQWCNGRLEFLERVINMPNIYYAQKGYDIPASSNMLQECAILIAHLTDPITPLFDSIKV